MAIRCPFCNFAVAVDSTRPGRRAARCIECGKRFLVQVPGDDSSRMLIVTEEPGPTAPEPPADPSPAPERATAAPVAKTPLPGGILRRLGGYHLVEELRRSDLGPRYLAWEITSGREVVIEAVDPRWASDSLFLARFAREAYAAAQLSHPNLVNVLDLGDDRGTAFVVTEPVDGQDFADLSNAGERPDVREAAAWILQASRGLAFAYDHGMTHGAIRPEDLRLDRRGLVKVAGVGLLRGPAAAEEHERRQPAIGDPRGDIAALGDVFRSLLGPRPLPADLAGILRRMTAENPNDRFPHHDEVIRALERFLGIESTAGFLPRQEDAARLEAAAAAFREAPSAKVRRQLVLGFLATVALLVFLTFARGRAILAGGFLGLGLLTIASYFVVDGLTQGGALFAKTREFALGSRPGDWLAFSGGVILLLTALTALHLLGVWLAFLAAGILLAVALHRTVDRRVEAERRPALDDANDLFRTLRRQGVGELSLRRFASTHAGRRWEEFHEALLGYEATLAARELLGRDERNRLVTRLAAWRDPLLRSLDAKLRSRRDARDEDLLRRVEERGLVARGENLVTARRKARRTAEAMVAVAADARASPGSSATFHIALAKALRDAATRPEDVLVSHEQGLIRDRESLADTLLGPRVRFLAGALLLAGCLAWMHQNALVPGDRIGEIASNALQAEDLAQARAHLEKARDLKLDMPGRTRPLSVPMLPGWAARSFHGFGPGAAGLILLASCLVRGRRIGLFAVSGAAVALLGPRLGVPAIGPIDAAAASMILGAAIAALGLVFGRR